MQIVTRNVQFNRKEEGWEASLKPASHCDKSPFYVQKCKTKL